MVLLNYCNILLFNCSSIMFTQSYNWKLYSYTGGVVME